MRILVTGCHGFIGHHTCAALIRAGHEIMGTDRIDGAISPKGARIKALAKVGPMKFADVDLSDFEATRDLVKSFAPQSVVHLAAQFPIRHGAAAIDSYVNSNIRAWLNVAESCLLAKVPQMVYASSVTAKDNGRHSSLYGVTKRFAELAAYVYSQKGMAMVGLRYAAVYGPEIRRDSQTYRIARAVMAGKTLDARELSNLTHMVEISDAAEITARFATTKMKPGSVVYLVAADDEQATMADVAEVIGQQLGAAPIWPDEMQRKERGGRPDCTRLESVIGFRPAITMEEGMRRFCEWFRGHVS